MFNKLIEAGKGKIYGFVIRSGWYRDKFINKLIEDLNKNDRTMLWQTSGNFHDCKRIELYFTTDLNVLWEDYVNTFDVLIISFFPDWANTKETTEFIEKIKKDERLKDKTIIIFFKAKTESKQIHIEDFNNLTDVILSNCDQVFLCNEHTIWGDFVVEEIFSEEKRFWKKVDKIPYDTLEEYKDNV